MIESESRIIISGVVNHVINDIGQVLIKILLWVYKEQPTRETTKYFMELIEDGRIIEVLKYMNLSSELSSSQLKTLSVLSNIEELGHRVDSLSTTVFLQLKDIFSQLPGGE